MSLLESFANFFSPAEVTSITEGEHLNVSASLGEQITNDINLNIDSYAHDLAQQQSATYPNTVIYGITGLNASPEPVQIGGDPVLPFEYFHDNFIQVGGSKITSNKLKKIITKKKLVTYCKKMGLKSCQKNIDKIKSYITGISLYSVSLLRSLVKNKDNTIKKTHYKHLKKAIKSKK